MDANGCLFRVLALDLRLQRFGYVVLEGPEKLLTWGIRTYRATDVDRRAQLVRKRISPLLKMFRPSVIVANHVSGLNVRRGSGHFQIVRAIEAEGQAQSADLVLLGRKEVQRMFGQFGRTTKDAIAAQATLFFPELTWKLPPSRKAWMSEHHNLTIFDAVALGITYFNSRRNSLSDFPQPHAERPAP